MSDSKIFFPSQPILPVDNSSLKQHKNSLNTTAATGASFADILQKASDNRRVTFSSHALQRMESRNLSFSEKDLQKLDDTVNRMAQKGARESLIYMNDMALVVSVANRTVITNIDSAAIL